jgi:hypothetical protein
MISYYSLLLYTLYNVHTFWTGILLPGISGKIRPHETLLFAGKILKVYSNLKGPSQQIIFAWKRQGWIE